MTYQTIDKLLVANRGEIAIRIFRAASELNIPTVAVFTYEDRYSLHRYKADEAYQIGADDDPLKPYLDIEEIIQTAKKQGANAIHPGYGFLSENVDFARRCGEEGIIFIGPRPEVMQQLGDKVAAKIIARKAKVPVIEDSENPLDSAETAAKEAQKIGYPVILKAAGGGGGRGMRVCHDEPTLRKSFIEARSEAEKAFGNSTIFIEKYIDEPKHIEVQIMGDNYGKIVHLYERDCSVQRRFQKVVEIAPSLTLSRIAKEKLYQHALAIAKEVNYNNVGTVEFLVDKDENCYFIEVNPRIQVEHTITEEITGVDLVRNQILIAQGYPLEDKQIYILSQKDIRTNGFAIQCRITTENPAENFKPDYGRIIAYRSAGGMGIRLDTGNCYTGAYVSPFFDPMLVKISAKGRTLWGAAQRLHRALREFRIRGVNTNIDFLLNVISHPTFTKGEVNVKFIDTHKELFVLPRRLDRGTRALRFLAEMSVNGNPSVKQKDPEKKFRTPQVPPVDKFEPYPKGSKDRLREMGREKFVSWLKAEKPIHYTDTTLRDAHQSLLATRVRPFDMLKVAEGFAKDFPQTFSMEVWGGATFDVSMRFLYECPWERLRKIREAVPNILLQMLLRGSNAVGYKAYPDNLIVKFVEEAAETGIDIFRIFDSLNWLEAMKVSIKAVRERTESLAEVCICYTDDLINPKSDKYNLQYYLDLARRIEDEGAHILAIKDMAGLLRPYSATMLIEALKQHIDIPIHLHTHDTASVQSATYLKAIEAGVDVVDVALASMSGLTSQPNFNSLVACLQGNERELAFDLPKLNAYSNYWEDVREFYYPFESGLKAGTAEVYAHEIPGGQYSNLRPQAEALGLGEKFDLVKQNYIVANRLLGDIVKVTPSSKVIGDFALYMTANGITEEDIFSKGDTLSFPESLKSMLKGDLGQPHAGFPEAFQKIVLKGEQPFTDRPNAHLEPIDFDAEFEAFKKDFPNANEKDLISYLLYPKVFKDFYDHYQSYGDVSLVPTLPFFYGMKIGQEILVEIGEGKILIIKLNFIGEPDEEGIRVVTFEMNGQTRRIRIKDAEVATTKVENRKAEGDNEVGSPLQGRIAEVLVKVGDEVKPNDSLFVIEAMKMETTVSAPKAGRVKEVVLKGGTMVSQDDLVLVIE
ncbi:MAG: pyruvate carboxylase [Bernardetiaceae bacterium]|nr:pyruvate carboxylase [Bernardetiaceae bacterium]